MSVRNRVPALLPGHIDALNRAMSFKPMSVPLVKDETALEEALEQLYRQWGALGFWAKRFHQTFSPGRKRYIGGIAAVRSVLTAPTIGFGFLKRLNCLNLSVENLILKPEWEHLFGEEDRAMARERLRQSESSYAIDISQ
jgi:hypothetical protein